MKGESIPSHTPKGVLLTCRHFSTLCERPRAAELTASGDVYLFIRKFAELSDGQRYRHRIAKILHSGAEVMVLVEFLSTLDRDAAKAIAYCLQKIARRERRVIRTD